MTTDWLSIVFTAVATGFGVAIGNEVWAYFKKKHKQVKHILKKPTNELTEYLKKETELDVNGA